VRVRNGDLQLIGGLDEGGKHMSGAVANKSDQIYGRWEVRLRVEKGRGYSAVAVLWPETNNWPGDGEINMIEVPRGDRALGQHWIHNGPDDDKMSHTVHVDFSQWRKLAVDWLPDHVTYYLDDVPQWTVKRSEHPELIPSTAPMHLALQLDVISCTESPTYCPNDQTPSEILMLVDWVKVYAPPPGIS
jgi:beta-glucanase (GH16 family)